MVYVAPRMAIPNIGPNVEIRSRSWKLMSTMHPVEMTQLKSKLRRSTPSRNVWYTPGKEKFVTVQNCRQNKGERGFIDDISSCITLHRTRALWQFIVSCRVIKSSLKLEVLRGSYQNSFKSQFEHGIHKDDVNDLSYKLCFNGWLPCNFHAQDHRDYPSNFNRRVLKAIIYLC